MSKEKQPQPEKYSKRHEQFSEELGNKGKPLIEGAPKSDQAPPKTYYPTTAVQRPVDPKEK